MRLATWEARGAERFGVVTADGGLIDLSKRLEGRFASLLDVIRAGAAAEIATLVEGAQADGKVSDVALLPPVPRPGKIVCVGVNYPERNAEYKDGSEAPKYPSLFVRFPHSFVGHGSPILRPPESTQYDYEGEIVIVIGKAGRRIPEMRAHEHVFGLTLMNEGSVRDWLRHGKFNVTQGKNFDRSGSIGPWIVTSDELDPRGPHDILTRVNGEMRQQDSTERLMFPFDFLIAYLSTFATLRPGDMIATGTPTGAGARFDPPRWLKPGDVVEVESTGIGVLRNTVVAEK